MFDKNKIEQGIKLLLEGIGEDPSREGLVDTPNRVARMYEELCAGMAKIQWSICQRLLHVIMKM